MDARPITLPPRNMQRRIYSILSSSLVVTPTGCVSLVLAAACVTVEDAHRTFRAVSIG